MMKTYPLVNELFPITSGIFSHCNYDFNLVTKEELDRLFFSNYGLRPVSPLVTCLVTSTKATDDDMNILATTLSSLCQVKWDKLKELYITDYDPIHNYFDELTENVEDTGEKNVTSSNTDSGTSTNTERLDSTKSNNSTRTESNSSSENGTNNTDSSIYGFNANTATPSNYTGNIDTNKYQGSSSITNEESQTDNVDKFSENTHSRKVTTQRDSGTSNTRVKTSTHKGNIGNLTTQQMMTQEIELRKWNFIESVLEDAKELFTLPIYL